MKKSILGFAALLVAFVLAYAFKPAPAPLTTAQFELISATADPFDPASYQVSTVTPNSTLCPAQSKVCVLIVPTADLYTSGANNGKPKVDEFGTGKLGEDLNDVLSISGSNPTTVNSRVIWEKN